MGFDIRLPPLRFIVDTTSESLLFPWKLLEHSIVNLSSRRQLRLSFFEPCQRLGWGQNHQVFVMFMPPDYARHNQKGPRVIVQYLPARGFDRDARSYMTSVLCSIKILQVQCSTGMLSLSLELPIFREAELQQFEPSNTCIMATSLKVTCTSST